MQTAWDIVDTQQMFVECINVLSSAMISVLLSLKFFYFYFCVRVNSYFLITSVYMGRPKAFLSFLSLPRGDFV